eukprot:1363767-Pyramimonas_sp.AAC.1
MDDVYETKHQPSRSSKSQRIFSADFVVQRSSGSPTTTFTRSPIFLVSSVVLDVSVFGEDELPPWAGVVVAPRRPAEMGAAGQGSQPKQAKGGGEGGGDVDETLLQKVAALSLATACEQAIL